MKVPVPRSDAALLPIEPVWVLFDGGPNLLRCQSKAGSQSAHGARDVHADQDAANIEDDGAKLRVCHRLLFLGMGDLRGTPCAHKTNDDGQHRYENDYHN